MPHRTTGTDEHDRDEQSHRRWRRRHLAASARAARRRSRRGVRRRSGPRSPRRRGSARVPARCAKLTEASTPSSLLSFRSIRWAQEAHVIPSMSRSTSRRPGSVAGAVMPDRRGQRPDEPRDRGRGLGQLLVGVHAAAHGVADAVRQVVVEQPQRDRLQGLRHRRDLRQDVDAVLVLLDHPLQTARLPLDPSQSLEDVVLRGLVPRVLHVGNHTPSGYQVQSRRSLESGVGVRPVGGETHR